MGHGGFVKCGKDLSVPKSEPDWHHRGAEAAPTLLL